MSSFDASVTLDDVFVVVAARRVPLAPELAGYLVLEIAEGASPRGGDVDPKSVFIGEEGSVAIVRPKTADGDGDAESSIRGMLARLLEGAGAQPAALAAATRRPCGAGLPSLARELEAALIPVNRAAARRALARFAREVRRVTLGIGRNASIPPTEPPPSRRPSFHPPSSSSPSDPRADGTGARPSVRSEPDEALTPPPPSTSSANHSAAHPPAQPLPPPLASRPNVSRPEDVASTVDDLVASFHVSGEGEQRAARELKGLVGIDLTPPPPPPTLPSLADSENRAGDSHPLGDGADVLALASEELTGPLPSPPRKVVVASSGSPVVRVSVAKGLVLLMVGGVVAVVAGVSWMRGQSHEAAGAGSSLINRLAAAAHSPFTANACRSEITVVDVPPHAEIYVREGQAPVDVGSLPVGARVDLVVTADGYASKHAVIPAGASWDTGPDGAPRFELPVTLEPAPAGAWPAPVAGARNPSSIGAPGTAHIVTAPRGADVWRFVGAAPEIKVDRPSCEGDVELLVAGTGGIKRRLRVASGDFVARGALRSARLSAK